MTILTEYVSAARLRPGDRFIHVNLIGRKVVHQIAMVISVTPTSDPPSTEKWRDITCFADGQFTKITGTAMTVRRLLEP